MRSKNSSPCKPCTKTFARTASLEDMLELPLLTFEQEATASAEQLFAHNTRFAVRKASAYYSLFKQGNLQLFINAALTGLWHAAKRYDGTHPERGKFISLATWFVRREFQLARVALRSGISIPVEAERGLTEMKAGRKFNAKKQKRLEAIEGVCSLDPLPEGMLGRDNSPDAATAASRAGLHDEIKSVFDTLPKQFRAVLSYRLGLDENKDPQTLQQIATRWKVTRERVRQIEFEALRLFRRRAARSGLDVTALKLFS